MFGVRLILLPYAEIAWDAWSSAMMNRMFGRCSEAAELLTAAPSKLRNCLRV